MTDVTNWHIKTARLRLRRITSDDAAFALEMLNDADFLQNIGDRGVRTLEDARRYLEEGPIASYEEHDHGLYAVCRRERPGKVIGMCGLLKRDDLPAPDLGFALLPGARRRGYTLEAAKAVLECEPPRLGLTEVLAITDPSNEASIRLLQRLGFEAGGTSKAPRSDDTVNLYRLAIPPAVDGPPPAGD